MIKYMRKILKHKKTEVSESESDIKGQYQRHTGKKIIFIIFSFFLLIFFCGIGLSVGSAGISIWEAYAAILHKFLPNYFHVNWLANTCVWDLRLPRISMGVVAGFSLGISGAVMQAILRNPLASPYTLGISAGASFGAALAIIVGFGIIEGPYLIIGNAFIFSILCSFLILVFASRRRATPEDLILLGIGILYIFSAATTIVEYFGEEEAVEAAVFWTVGSLDRASWTQVTVSSIILLCFIPLLMRKSWDLNIMVMGDEAAKSLGVNAKHVRVLVIIITALMVASTVCFTGTIGFVGLVAPHIARLVIGGDNRFLLPSSGILGSVLLVGADILARNIIPPIVLPVGAITAFMGGPLLVYLVNKRRKKIVM